MYAKQIEQHTVDAIVSIHDTLASCNLKPSPLVNKVFGHLVSLVDTTPQPVRASVLAHGRVQQIHRQLQSFASQGEAALEAHWADQIITSHDPHATLAQFPYTKNYKRLISFEVAQLRQIGLVQPARILFVGAGPLPLSVLVLEELYGCTIDFVDSDVHACTQATRVLQALNVCSQSVGYNTDIRSYTAFDAYDLIIVAALVGDSVETKRDIVEHIATHARQGTYMLLRSADDLITLLYPSVCLEQLAGVTVLKKSDRPAGVLNSVIITQVL